MGRMAGIKWEKAVQCRPAHNIASSDFPKYNPQPWKFMEGKSRIDCLLSNEYCRQWIKERDTWQKHMYEEVTTTSIDIIKNYVLSFKTCVPPPKQEKKELFIMKKFKGISSKIVHRRPPGDKAMSFNKIKSPGDKK